MWAKDYLLAGYTTVSYTHLDVYKRQGVTYSQFVEQRLLRRESQIAAAKRQDKEIEHTKELIAKFRAKKDKAAFAQTLIHLSLIHI